MKSRLAASDTLYLKPLLFGLDRRESPFDLDIDIPAKNAIKLSERSDGIRNAFLSPIDYARHGGEYRIYRTSAPRQPINQTRFSLLSNLICVILSVSQSMLDSHLK